MSQSAISQSLNQLEDFVQAPLLDRSTRPATLTERGEAFHLLISQSFGRIAQEVEALRASCRDTRNSLTVSCNLGFATYWLMPRLNAFNERFPDITLNIMTTYQGGAELSPGVDVAIRFGDGDWLDGSGDLLFTETMIPACAPRYLARRGPIEGPASLIHHNLIEVSATDPSWLDWARYLKHFGLAGPNRAAGSRFSNYVQAVQATLAGDGIMLGWRSTVGDFFSTGQMVAAVDAPVRLTSGYFLLMSHQAKHRMAMNAFVQWLQEIVREEPASILG